MLYRILLFSVKQQHESAIGATPPGWYRIDMYVWIPWNIEQIPIGYLLYKWQYKLLCYSLYTSPLSSPLPVSKSLFSMSLHCYSAHIFISTIFLDSTYIYISKWYLSFSFWVTSLCIIGSKFTHLIRTDSNSFLFMAH